MAVNEVVIFAGKVANLEMPAEARQALDLKDGDQVEVVVRKATPKTSIPPDAKLKMMKRHNFFIRAI